MQTIYIVLLFPLNDSESGLYGTERGRLALNALTSTQKTKRYNPDQFNKSERIRYVICCQSWSNQQKRPFCVSR